MSTEPQPDAAPPAKSKQLALLVVIVVGVVVGGAAGAFVAAPLLVGKPAAAATIAAPAEGAGPAAAKPGESKVVHLVDNLVLNPAGSGGSRFLLLSIGLGVKDDAAASALQGRDPELRDVVLGVVGRRTIEQLADIGTRDSLKVEIRAAVGARFPAAPVGEVYFPQFVIQ